MIRATIMQIIKHKEQLWKLVKDPALMTKEEAMKDGVWEDYRKAKLRAENYEKLEWFNK